MFDIGFSEMLVCAVVALVVIGPERLPKVARTLGHLFGRMQRYVAQVKSDIHREMDMADLGKVKTEFESAARSFKSEVEASASETEREWRELQSSVDRGLEEPSANAASAAPAPPPPELSPEPSPQLELGIDAPVAKPPPRDA